jgi:transposase
MQQNLFSKPVEQDKKNDKIHLGTGLEIQIINGFKPRARLYRLNVLVKTVDLSDRTARRLFVVEVVELGATKSKLAEVLGISRQTIHNYVETQKKFGTEGLINSYQPSNSKSRATQRKINKEKLPKGNTARLLEEIRRKERAEKEQNAKQLPLFSSDVAEEIGCCFLWENNDYFKNWMLVYEYSQCSGTYIQHRFSR